MKWIIVVLMALYNPQPNKDDAVVMLSADNKPLIFSTTSISLREKIDS